MPKKDGSGPPISSRGPRDGRGKGKGRQASQPGSGRKSGGGKGRC